VGLVPLFPVTDRGPPVRPAAHPKLRALAVESEEVGQVLAVGELVVEVRPAGARGRTATGRRTGCRDAGRGNRSRPGGPRSGRTSVGCGFPSRRPAGRSNPPPATPGTPGSTRHAAQAAAPRRGAFCTRGRTRPVGSTAPGGAEPGRPRRPR